MNSTETEAITVTEYLGKGLNNCLYVHVLGFPGIVVTKEGEYKGFAFAKDSIMYNHRHELFICVVEREDVKKNIADFLENEKDQTNIYVTEYLGDLKDCLFVKITGYVGIVVTRNGDYCGTAASQNSVVDKLHHGDTYLTSIRLEVDQAIANFLENEKAQTKIYVTEYLGDLENCLFVAGFKDGNFVVSRTGEFKGLARSPDSSIILSRCFETFSIIKRPGVKKAVADFLKKETQEKKSLLDRIESLETDLVNMAKILQETREIYNHEVSKPQIPISTPDTLTVVEYTGDDSCIRCVYVSSPGKPGRVVDYITRNHIGYAHSSTSKISNSKPWEKCDDAAMKAIDEYLFTKPGELQQGGVIVRRALGDKTHLIVTTCKHNFVVCRETREIVSWSKLNSCVVKQYINKNYFQRLDKTTNFSSVIASYVRGIRGVIEEEKTIKTILEPFKEKYLAFLEKKKAIESTPNMHFSVIGKISCCLVNKDLQVILDTYPAFSHGESIRMALVDLYGGL